MSMEATTVETSGPASVSGPAAITPTGPNTVVGAVEADLIAYPQALLRGLAVLLVWLGALFTIILLCALGGNTRAEGYLVSIFGASAVWGILAAVVGVSAVGVTAARVTATRQAK